MDIIRQAAQEIVADRNKIKNTDIKCGVSITDVIETELTDKRTAVDKVIADRNIIEVEDILGAVKTQDILPEKDEPVEPTLESIELDTENVKTEYNSGEELDLTGLIVTANYSDGSSEEVTDYTSTPEEGSEVIGPDTIEIEYEGQTATFDVHVEGENQEEEPRE